jgi:hypothetical protein
MPTSMRFTLDAMEHERQATIEVPCTSDGAPTGAQAAAWR